MHMTPSGTFRLPQPGLLVEDWAVERLVREENQLFAGFRVEPDDEPEPKPRVLSDGEDLSTSVSFAHEDVIEVFLKIRRSRFRRNGIGRIFGLFRASFPFG